MKLISIAIPTWIPEVIPYGGYPWGNFPVLLDFFLTFTWNLRQKIHKPFINPNRWKVQYQSVRTTINDDNHNMKIENFCPVFVYFTKRKHLRNYEKNYFTEKGPSVFDLVKILYLSFLFYFSPVGHYWIYGRNWLVINTKVYDVITFVNLNSKIQIVWWCIVD